MGESGLMMRCTKCGEMNKLPTVHCKKCGAKLDFEAAERQMIQADGGRAGFGLRNGIRMVLIVALLGIVLLLIWPGEMARTTGEEIDARRYRVTTELLVDALSRGVPEVRTIAERDVNAHLAEVVASQPAPKGSLSSVVEDVAVRFSPGRAEVFIAVRRGPFTLTGRFEAKPDGAEMSVTGAQAGHLPLPGLLGKLYAHTVGGVFRQMRNESRILRNLDSAVVSDGSIELATRSGK